MLILVVLLLSVIEEFVWGNSPEMTWFSIWSYGLVGSSIIYLFNKKIGNILLAIFLLLYGSFILISDYHFWLYKFSEVKHYAFMIFINLLYVYSIVLVYRNLRGINKASLFYRVTGKEITDNTLRAINVVAISISIALIIIFN